MSEEIKDIDYKKIGENIRLIRMTKGISQIKLARSLDISQTHMSNIENGNTGLSLATAIKISKYLGCSIDELVYGKKQLKDNERDNNVLSGFSAEDLLDALKLIALKNKLHSDEHMK